MRLKPKLPSTPYDVFVPDKDIPGADTALVVTMDDGATLLLDIVPDEGPEGWTWELNQARLSDSQWTDLDQTCRDVMGEWAKANNKAFSRYQSGEISPTIKVKLKIGAPLSVYVSPPPPVDGASVVPRQLAFKGGMVISYGFKSC